MTVWEFIVMFVDPETQKFELWSNSKQKVVFSGYLIDIPEDIEDEILDAEITGIGNLQANRDIITLNVDKY